MQPFRLESKLPPHALKTYAISAPRQTHYREATCIEVECRANAMGWITKIDPNTQLGASQLNYIRLHSGRAYTDMTSIESPLVELLFPAGQKCFAQHVVPLEREPIFYVKGGDWRGNPRQIPTTVRAANDWVDDFANHQDQLNTAHEKG